MEKVFFFDPIKDKIHTIFDIGYRDESLMLDFSGNVHYFDPVNKHVENLCLKPNKNII
jgi:hypothetical protein